MTALLHHPAALGCDEHEPAILRPFDDREVLTPREAALVAGRCERTIKLWAEEHHIGRKVVGRWAISKVALSMFLDDNHTALFAYLAGDRSSPIVTAYYESEGLAEIVGRLAKRAAAEK